MLLPFLKYEDATQRVEKERKQQKRIFIFFKQLFLKNILKRNRLERTVKRRSVAVWYHFDPS